MASFSRNCKFSNAYKIWSKHDFFLRIWVFKLLFLENSVMFLEYLKNNSKILSDVIIMQLGIGVHDYFFISNWLISNCTEILPKIKQLKYAQYWNFDYPNKQLLLSNQYWRYAFGSNVFKWVTFREREREISLIVTVICIYSRICLQEAQQPIHYENGFKAWMDPILKFVRWKIKQLAKQLQYWNFTKNKQLQYWPKNEVAYKKIIVYWIITQSYKDFQLKMLLFIWQKNKGTNIRWKEKNNKYE